jgi:hypothetical protein
MEARSTPCFDACPKSDSANASTAPGSPQLAAAAGGCARSHIESRTRCLSANVLRGRSAQSNRAAHCMLSRLMTDASYALKIRVSFISATCGRTRSRSRTGQHEGAIAPSSDRATESFFVRLPQPIPSRIRRDQPLRAVDRPGPGVSAPIQGANGTVQKTIYKTMAYGECSITLACYLCNTIPKTG